MESGTIDVAASTTECMDGGCDGGDWARGKVEGGCLRAVDETTCFQGY